MAKTCSTQRFSVVTNSLMGIIFGCAIIYIITRMVAMHRRLMYLETHIVKKADDDTMETLASRVDLMQQHTEKILTGLTQEVQNVMMADIKNDHVPTQPQPVHQDEPSCSVVEGPSCSVVEGPSCSVVEGGVVDQHDEETPPPAIIKDSKFVEDLPIPDQGMSTEEELSCPISQDDVCLVPSPISSNVVDVVDVDDDSVHLNVVVKKEPAFKNKLE